MAGSGGRGPLRVVVMGPSGVGKSLIGAALAARLGLPFTDGDALHPRANVDKMSAGIPLTDADRAPWLDTVGRTLADAPDGIVVACSALRRVYRDRILAAAPDAFFVELRAPRAELDRRMHHREHFMPSSLLDSQLATWEPLQADEPGASFVNEGDPATVVDAVVRKLA